jgi:PAS domain S-box-containing protein
VAGNLAPRQEVAVVAVLQTTPVIPLADIEKIEDLDEAQRLQLLVKSVIDYAIYLLSIEGRVLTWNSGAERLKGYRAEEIIGQPFSLFYPPEDRDLGIPQKGLEITARTGRFETEGWRVRKDGTRFWALVVIDAVRNEAGKLLGFAKVTRDLTERQVAQQSIAEGEGRYRQLIEAVTDYAIFQLDANGFVSTWNPGAERIKGYRAEDIIGRHFSCFYTAEDRKAGVPDKVLDTAKREGRYEAEAWRVRKDGSRLFASVVIDPIRSGGGEITGFAKVTRDITSKHEVQNALKEAQEQLAVAQKMEAVGQLSGGIAHDFNNLMMIVLGNLETIKRNTSDLANIHPNLERNLNNAIRGAQRAASLTSRLLAFSRRQPLDPKPLDVNKFLSGSAEFLQRSLGELFDVEVVGAAGLWQIEVDGNQLEAALVNVAINSRDAMPNGGKLTIEAANTYLDAAYCQKIPELSPGQFVVICITDTGEGMDRDVLSHAFEPFFTTKEVGHGTGLGLSQVYGFVKQSGGHVKIYSEVSQGTTVKLYFPRFAGEISDEEIEAPEILAQGEQGETILLVEDDKDVRTYLSDALRGLHYRVLSAADATIALKLLNQDELRIDILLTDIVMPGMNGRELGEKATQMRPRLKVLYMTGYSRNAVVHHGRLDQGVDLLQKPISTQVLASRLRDALD